MDNPQFTDLQVSTDTEFTNKLIDHSGPYVISHPVSAGILYRGIPLYARTRHRYSDGTGTGWSSTRQFSVVTLNNSYINIIGDESSTLNNNFTDIYVAPDGSMYLSGACNYTPQLSGKILMVKLDVLGNVVWKRSSSITTNNWANKIGGMVNDVLYTSGYGTIAYVNCVYLTQWKTDGSINWQKVFQSPSAQYADSASCFVANSSHVYMVMYNVNQGDNLLIKGYIFKLNTGDGSVVWGKKIVMPNESCIPYDVVVDSNGSVFVLCTNVTTNKMFILKFDSNGTLISAKQLEFVTPYVVFTKLYIINDSIFIYGSFGGALSIIKVSNNLDILWKKYYNVSNSLQIVTGLKYENITNTLCVCGNINIVNADITIEANISGSTDSDIAFLKIDFNTGNLITNRVLKNTLGMVTAYRLDINANSASVNIVGKIANTNDYSKWSCFHLSVPVNLQNCLGIIPNRSSLYWEMVTIDFNSIDLSFVDIFPSISDFDLCTGYNTINSTEILLNSNKFSY